MQQFTVKSLAVAAATTFIFGIAVLAQRSPAAVSDNDWPMFSRDLSGSRFSPLADIHPGNVAQLAQAWSVQLTAPAGRRGGGAAPAPAAGAAAGGQAPVRGAAPAGRAGGAAAAGDGEGEAAGSNPQ